MAPKRPLRQRPSTASKQATVLTPKRRRKASPTSPSHPPAPFFTILPRELRDAIYNEIWTSKAAFHLSYKDSQFFVSYTPSTTPPSSRLYRSTFNGTYISPAPWIFANKQMLAEAIEQFHRQSTWTFKRDEFSYNVPVRRAPSRLLISPWKTHTLDLGTLRVSEQAELQSNEKTVTSLVQFIQPVIQPLQYRRMGYIRAPNLRVLKAELAVCSYAPCKDADRPIEVDFRALTSLDLPSLNMVEMRVSFGSYFEGDALLKGKLKDAVKDLGGRLMQGPVTWSFDVVEGLELVWVYRFLRV